MFFFYLIGNLPKIIYETIFLKKKRKNLLDRLGMRPIPKAPSDKKVFWVHGVSVGEIKASLPLLKKIKENYPDTYIIVSTLTETGNLAANRFLHAFADKILFLPFDFSFVTKRYFQALKPDYVFIIETDFWYHFLKTAKKFGAKVFLISGKISERSYKRFKALSFFTKRLFVHIDKFIVQNDRYLQMFLGLNIPKEKLFVGGNLKYLLPKEEITTEELEELENAFLLKGSWVITLASTHFPEEKMLLEKLLKIQGPVKIFLAPRHPERCREIQSLLQSLQISYSLFSQSRGNAEDRVILIDQMGKLPLCFSLSQKVIVGGSFIPKIGGHNILEPTLYGRYVLFGPYMGTQEDLLHTVLERKIGKQVSLEELSEAITETPQHLSVEDRGADCKEIFFDSLTFLNIGLK